MLKSFLWLGKPPFSPGKIHNLDPGEAKGQLFGDPFAER